MLKFLLYAIRWQLSTPLLAVIVYYTVVDLGALKATILANFVGSCVFFWVDRYLFTKIRG